MVDMGIAGHLDAVSATAIGGIAIGSMLFDLLYWNFGFLRIGTGGLAAQAYGMEDRKECARILLRGLGIAFLVSLVLLAVQWIFLKGAFLVVDCTPEVRELASRYFLVRIWAAPATLCLMAFKGWFIGMQDGISAMITDLMVNGMNIILSAVFAFGLSVGGVRIVDPMGFVGIAAGTVAAQWCGLLTATLLLMFKYYRTTVGLLDKNEVLGVFRGQQTRRFFTMNADLFVRSACMIAIYIGFTTMSARHGDQLLAVSSILMKILMLFSYFTDGFAYAGEALTGRYIGAGDAAMVRKTVKWTFIWSMALAAVFMVVYQFAGVPLLQLMTDDSGVVATAEAFLPWLLLMPPVGCAAFTWDGIFIGATASRQMRNSMLWAVVSFALVWGAGMLVLSNTDLQQTSPYQYAKTAIHILMAAYFAHLLARTVYMSVKARSVLNITGSI